jgi:hypothetical protein
MLDHSLGRVPLISYDFVASAPKNTVTDKGDFVDGLVMQAARGFWYIPKRYNFQHLPGQEAQDASSVFN